MDISSEISLEQQIAHYQERLERHVRTKNKDILLHCLHRLKHLPITVIHLNKYQLGKTVRKFRQCTGSTGVKAISLVNQWNHMIAREAESISLEHTNEGTMENGNQRSNPVNKEMSQANTTSPVEKPNSCSPTTPYKLTYNFVNQENLANDRRQRRGDHHTSQPPLNELVVDKNQNTPSNNKASSQKIYSSKKTTKRKHEALDPFELALTEMDSYSPKPKRRALSKVSVKKNKEVNTLKSSDVVDPVKASPVLLNETVERPVVPPLVLTSYNNSLWGVRQSNEGNDALDLLFSTKANRKRSKYTGKKPEPTTETPMDAAERKCDTSDKKEVPTLFNQCITFLQKNIDCLGFTGIPYYIMETVLKMATPSQLFYLEDCNPEWLLESSPLWERHCKNQFKYSEREEMETFREMYYRCTQEEEQKFERLKEKLHQNKEAANASQKCTKITMSHTMNGRKRQSTISQLRLAMSNKSAGGVATGRTTRLIYGPAAARKPTVAPLMAKSMKCFKNLRRH